jgi:hypothetical protein
MGVFMLAYVFLFLAASILVFQGTHLLGEIRGPLGAVPNELALPERAARRWGERLLGFGGLTMLIGVLSFPFHSLFGYFVPIIVIDGCALAAFALYLIFSAPRVQYLGKPSDDGHH